MTDATTSQWQIPEEVLLRNQSLFEGFLESQFDGVTYYHEAIRDVIDNNKKRVLINLDHLRQYDRREGTSLARGIITKPREYVDALDRAINLTSTQVKQSPPGDLRSGIFGPMGDNFVSPRTLGTRLLGQMVCLDGIVTKASLVSPRLVEAVQYAPATKRPLRTNFYDSTDLNELPSKVALPTKDPDGNPYEMEFGLSTFIDHQVITIQERPESSPAGQMPRSCDVIADRDLSDMCKPGDRVKIYGVYRVTSNRSQGNFNGVYKALLIAYHVEVTADLVKFSMTPKDIENITSESKRSDILEVLSRSIAPSICGHDIIKKSIILLLVGGTECNLNDGAHIRGDINLLMVGDPSTAKSQLLRRVMSVAPLAVNTTGRGSSGVGLTAAVSSDPETGERRLEAGAMVIADRGVVCIDEFDKMDETDRVAIHEALEQQTVTISKAGIHATLNARCSVVAAANPVWGTYEAAKSPMENIGLPDSLLSRFDLLFIVLDQRDPKIDAMIADRVLRSHRWRGELVSSNETGVYVQPDPLLHGEEDVVSIDFLKKYVSHAKSMKPTLTQGAIDELTHAWADIRAIQGRRSQPITPRTYETLIRLSTAHAKIRLSEEVSKDDAKEAIRLLRFSFFGDGEEEGKKKKVQRKKKVAPKPEQTKSVEVEDEEADEVNDEEVEDAQQEEIEAEEVAEEDVEEAEEDVQSVSETASVSYEDKRKALQEYIQSILNDPDLSKMEVAEFISEIEKKKGISISKPDMIMLLKELEQNNTIMFEGDNDVYFI